MKKMDVYLAEEAVQYLQAQAFDSSPQKRFGLLLGHRRGPRFFVERAFSCREGYLAARTHFLSLNRHFGGKIIGFFSVHSKPENPHRFFKPFAYGKVFLKVRAKARHELALKPFVIEYKDSFFLQPISLHPSPKEKT